MFVYIITDKAENATSPMFYKHKCTFEKYARDVCVILHYKKVRANLIAEINPWGILHSGCTAEFHTYDVLEDENYHRLITEWDGAQLGICGGHQIIAHAFGSKLGHIRKLRPTDADHNPGYHPGQFKEWGAYPIIIKKRDPIFEGLPQTIRVFEYHMDEVKVLSKKLEILASNTNCKVQTFKHRTKPVYGTQFHPEHSSKNYPDGIKVLENFCKLAKLHHKSSR